MEQISNYHEVPPTAPNSPTWRVICEGCENIQCPLCGPAISIERLKAARRNGLSTQLTIGPRTTQIINQSNKP